MMMMMKAQSEILETANSFSCRLQCVILQRAVLSVPRLKVAACSMRCWACELALLHPRLHLSVRLSVCLQSDCLVSALLLTTRRVTVLLCLSVASDCFLSLTAAPCSLYNVTTIDLPGQDCPAFINLICGTMIQVQAYITKKTQLTKNKLKRNNVNVNVNEIFIQRQ